MRLYGSQVRNAGYYVWGLTILVAFPCHFIAAAWFWALLGGLLVLSAGAILVLEILRLVAPGWTDEWWDPE